MSKKPTEEVVPTLDEIREDLRAIHVMAIKARDAGLEAAVAASELRMKISRYRVAQIEADAAKGAHK